MAGTEGVSIRQARIYANGAWQDGTSVNALHDKFTGRQLAEVHIPSREVVDSAVSALAEEHARIDLTNHERGVILATAADLLSRRGEEFVDGIVSDTGFTVSDAQGEVSRAIETLRLCAEEARRMTGHMVPLDGAPGIRGRLGFTLRRPVGVVCAITPFNAPLNTVCHKVGPALAAGNAVVLKPAAETPLTAEMLVGVLLEAGLPEGLIALLHGGADVGQWLLENQVSAFYAFTGSTRVGEHISRTIGLRRSQLELGSLASTLVCSDADLDRAADLCVNAGFRKSGQVCTSVQRLYVERDVFDEFSTLLTTRIEGRGVGDPREPGAFVGPVISAASADRIESWIDEAVDAGAEILHGGGRDRAVIQPTLIANVSPDMTLMRQEIFGPVVALRPYDDFIAAVNEANETPYGLAAGVFTGNLDRALDAARRLRVGTVHINETSSSRVDLMPFGGVKASGHGLEGPKYAMEEMTEQTLVTIGRSHP